MTSRAGSLIAHDVTRHYDGKAIVDGVSLALAPDTVTALLGASGAGKSTLLRLLAGLEAVDGGEIRLGDAILSRPGFTLPPERRQTGLIFQDFALFPHMTAIENVRFGLGGLTKPDGVARARAWLGRLGLESRARAYPHQLSGGEQQRVAIARALAPGPHALLMDEPFSGLDPALRDEVADITLSVVREAGLPALLVSHDAEAAMARVDRLAIMRDGRIVQAGTPDEVYDHPVDSGVAAALGPVHTLDVDRLPASLRPPGARPGQRLTYREDALGAQPGSAATGCIISVARLGTTCRVMIEIGGLHLPARLPARPRPQPGEEIPLGFAPEGCFLFEPCAAPGAR